MASKIQTVVEIVTTGLNSLKKVEKLFTSIFKKQQAINRTALKFNKVRASTRRVKGSGLNLNTSTPLEGLDDKAREQKLGKLSGTTRRYVVALNKANKELNGYVRSLATADGAQSKFTGSSRKITTQVSALQERLNSLSRTNKEYTSTLQATLRGEQALYKVQRNRAVDELAQFPEQRLKKDGTPDKRFTKTGVEDLVGTTIAEFDDGKVAKSINGLDNYIGRLEALKAKVELGGASFRKLEEQISRVNRVLEEGQLKGQSSKIEAAAKGPATKLDSIDAFSQKERFASDLNKAEDKRLQLLSRINDSSLAEVTKQKLKNKLSESDVQLQQKELELARATNKEVDKELSSLNKKQQKQKFRADRSARIKQSALIGGGFPFLFGGGPLQALAGGLGGGIGEAISPKGGFAGSIAATAAISQISQAVQAITELGQAFNKFTPNVNAIVAAMGVGGTAIGQQIQAYVDVANKTDALSEASRQMARIIGAEGVQGLKEWGEATIKWKNDFDRAILGIQATLARFAVWAANRFNLLDGDGGLGKRTKATTKAGTDKRMNELQQTWVDIQKTPFDTEEDITVEGQTFENKTDAINHILKLKQERQKILDLENAGLLVQKTVNEITKNQLQDLTEKRQVLEDTLQGGTTHAEIEKRMRAITKEVLGDNKELTAVQEKQIANQRVKVTDAVKEEESLRAQLELWKQIKDTIAGGLTSAIMGLIDGTKSLSESLAGILKQIAQIILQKAIISAIDKIPFGGGGVTTGSVSDLAPVKTAAQGAYWKNGIKGFSSGGLVTRPTIGLIGEAGEDEYIIPASKMSGAMDRYSAGARGQGVIPGGGTVASGSGVSSTPTVVNYTGPVLSFDSEAYVPKSAIPEIINSAARRGAQEGESKVFSKLKNSRSQRSRVGM